MQDCAGHRQGIFSGHMRAAMAEAEAAFARGEVPVGAAVADPGGQLAASAGNRIRELNDPTAHAELLAIREACRRAGSERLPGYRLYVTLEPCPMCASAISLARIARLYFAASDPKSGGVESGPRIFEHSQRHHRPEVYPGICEAESRELLRRFFDNLRRAT